MTYSDFLKRIKNYVGLQKGGEKVIRIHKTLKGVMIPEFQQSAMEWNMAYQKLVEKALGRDLTVELTTRKTKMEFKNLDEVILAEDLIAAVNTLFSCLSIKKEAVVSIRKAGTQTATLSAPTKSSKVLFEARKIEVDCVVSKIREKFTVHKCYRCLEKGHNARNSNRAKVRGKCCLKYSEADY